jgi:streptomycin 6-kinase
VIKLPHNFIQTIKNIHKNTGEEWLDNFDTLIEHCERKWQLKILSPFDLSYNFVASAIRSDGKQVVLKLAVPNKDFQSEVTALRYFAGKGMVEIIDVEMEKGILILERLAPGDTLATVDDDLEAARAAAAIMKSLWVRADTKVRIPTIEDREKSLSAFYKRHPEGKSPISKEIIQTAVQTFQRLISENNKRYILHGDLHHYNILKTEDNEWRAIDPKGLIGEREYDTIQFLLNKLPEDEDNIEPILKQRIKVLVDQLGLDERRILAWGFAHAVLSTCWSLEDGEDYSIPFFNSIFVFEKLHNGLYGQLN